MPKLKINTRTLSGIKDVPRDAWNGLLPARGAPAYHPFTDWDFLAALEQSGSASASTGWQPFHLLLEDSSGTPIAAAPLYVKSHSMGEYVFDQGWADASERAGVPYYPKLQCAIPFTPAKGPRLIAKTDEARTALISGLLDICEQMGLSSAHLTFIEHERAPLLEQRGFLIRTDRQFHFVNRGYKNFDDFLDALTSRKRKKIKSERRRACETITIKRLRGDDITTSHWDAFYEFYIDTSQRKWGRPYLTRDFFARIHDSMCEQVLLILAYQDGVPIAGALNFIGGDTLYGRHWGASKHIPFLHFELCYYQAIEAGMEMGLARVEAGAQGEHKLARGYEPIATYSAHHFRHPGLHSAIKDFLGRERPAIAQHIDMLSEFTPFKKGGD